MTRRLNHLACRRNDLIDRYAKARRRHDRTRATAAALLKATNALLKAELRARQAPSTPAARPRRTETPDLFQGAFA